MSKPRTRSELGAAEIVDWPHLPRTKLVDRLADLVSELFALYQEAATVEVSERQAKAQGFAASPESSVTLRDRAGAAAALAASLELVELRGRIAALESARELGFMLVAMGD